MQQREQVEAAVAAVIGSASRETQRSYRSAWRAWLAFLAQQGCAPGNATRADVQAWAEQMRGAGRRPSTIGARVAACRAVWRQLGGTPRRAEAEDIFAVVARISHAQGCGPVRREQRGTVPRLSAGQARRLLEAIDRRTARGARDYALLGLLLATGARASEVLCLRVGAVRRAADGRTDIWLDEDPTHGDRRTVAGWVYEAVQAYLLLMGRADADANEPLWRPLVRRFQTPGQVGETGPIGVAQANKILRRWLEQAGIDGPEQYSTSSLRGLWMGAG